MARDISNSEDILDSRDIIERIEELQALAEQMEEDGGEPFTSDDAEELRILLALQEQAEGYTDWKYGATLVRDSYFTQYAEQLADDIGAIDHNATWPLSCIDWDQAARELQMDYTSVDYDGVTYWVR